MMSKMGNDSGNNSINELMGVAFTSMLENTKDMMFVKDANLVYVAASVPFVKMVGKEYISEIIGRTDMEIFEDKGLAERYATDDKKLIASGKNLVDYIEPITDENGQARYGSTSKYILYGSNGELLGILGITRDITRDYRVRQHYQQELKYLFELPEDTYAVSYIDIDGWRIISQRRQVIGDGTMQSCYTVERLCEAALESIVDEECEAYEFYQDFKPELLKEIYRGGNTNLSFEYIRRLSDGSERWVHNDVRFLTDVDSGHLCAMLTARDIEEQKREAQNLVEAATMDKMTMLFNRETTMGGIRQILVDEADKWHVLFMVDVDNFKALNDTMGHQAGDDFLIEMASRMKKCFREDDIVGRVGGDEFFVFMRNSPDMISVVKKAEDLLCAIQEVCAGYESIGLSASIGVSVYPNQGTTLEELYAKADDALYRAKRKGKNRYIFAE